MAVGITRSLGRQGVPVIAATREFLPATSRYCVAYERWRNSASESQQVSQLLDLCGRRGLEGWTLFPTGDNESALVSRHEYSLGGPFMLTTAAWDVFRWAYDKRLTYQLAGQLGVGHPRTHYPRALDDLVQLDVSYPVLLKPAIKEQWNRFTSARGWRVDGRQALLERYAEACELVDPELVMVQELVPGAGEAQFSYGGLWAGGTELAWLVARRARQHPVDFGTSSTYVETADEPEVASAARRLLEAIGYSGMVEVEFKRDPRDHTLKLLDVNARAWAWHSLGRRAGVDFPYLMWRLAQGAAPPARIAPTAEARWMHLVIDVRPVAHELRRRRLSLRSYLRSFRRPLEFAMFNWNDPLPGAAEIFMLIRGACALQWTRIAAAARDRRRLPAPVPRDAV